ncbi:glutamate--cysteine ligase [Arthrobacter sp. USHLN218]|uniref:glutamate--cysteine ligase n=1 Tax=Arthrobacter sp. USHLN218 TaxID=3081232 RepID=UPI0030172398
MDDIRAGSSVSHHVTDRAFGVAEQFLIVDDATGELAAAAEPSPAPTGGREGRTGAGPVLKLKQWQIEAITPVCSGLGGLCAAVHAGREGADEAARQIGARAVALGTSVSAQSTPTAPLTRHLLTEDRFGLTASEQPTCGLHIHVAVSSTDEGVGVLDRIRIWLPVLLALSANSPFRQGRDSGFESFRYQVWSRWPSAGPCEVFGSPAAYRRYVEQLLGSGVLPDEGLVHFDARLSRQYPAVEVHIADVCLQAAHTAALAALVRALVETAAREWQTGRPAPAIPAAELRLAGWQASRSGIEKELLHPVHRVPCPASEVTQDLFDHVRAALAGFGDEAPVRQELASILREGTGSRRQRHIFTQTGSRMAVLADALACTHRDYEPVRAGELSAGAGATPAVVPGPGPAAPDRGPRRRPPAAVIRQDRFR